MSRIRRKWDFLPEEQRREYIKSIVDFFQTERDEEIGIIAAEKILDHFLQHLGIELYNKGVADSVAFLRERCESLELDMESLLKK